MSHSLKTCARHSTPISIQKQNSSQARALPVTTTPTFLIRQHSNNYTMNGFHKDRPHIAMSPSQDPQTRVVIAQLPTGMPKSAISRVKCEQRNCAGSAVYST